jgi:hypothetical protein
MKHHRNNAGDSDDPVHALSITCSESALHTLFVTVLEPIGVFQNLGGALSCRGE